MMKTSDLQSNLIAALLASVKVFPPVAKTKEGQAGNRKFKYAPYEDIKALCDPILWENGLLVTQGAEGHLLVTRLEHISGEWRETRMPMNEVHASDQAYGIEFSYKRRYSYQGILGIVTEEDVDGNAKKRADKPQDGSQVKSVRHSVRGEIGDDLPEDWKIYLRDLADDCTAMVARGKAQAAHEMILEAKLEDDQYVWMYSQLDSKVRTALTKYRESLKEPA